MLNQYPDLIAQALNNIVDRLHKLEVQQPQQGSVFEGRAVASGTPIIIPATYTDVDGTELVLDPGLYLLQATVRPEPYPLDSGATLEVCLELNGRRQSDNIQLALVSKSQGSQQWILSLMDYRQLVLDAAPVFYERFHELETIAGAYANLEIGDGYGLFFGAPTPQQPPAIGYSDMSGLRTYAMHFDGVNDYISYTGWINPFFSSVGTIAIWFKTTSSAVQYLIGNVGVSAPTSVSGAGAGMYINASGQIVGGLKRHIIDGGQSVTVVSPSAYNDSEWHQAVLAWGAGTVGLYIDKILVDSDTSVTPTHGGVIPPFQIGGLSAGNKFEGYLDEAELYEYKRDAILVEALYDAGQGVVTYPTELYQDVVTALAPVLRYRFNELLGPSSADESGNNNAGTINGNVIPASQGLIIVDRDGTYNRAYFFDGTNAYVASANSIGLAAAAAFSFECWCMPSALGSARTIMSTATARAYLGKSAADKLVFGLYGSTIVTGATSLEAGRIAHAVATYDGTNLRLYLNGVLDAGPTALAAFSGVHGVINIGRESIAGEYFPGIIDEPTMYPVALSAADAEQLYLTGKTNRAWVNLVMRKIGGTDNSELNDCKLVATRLFAASRS